MKFAIRAALVGLCLSAVAHGRPVVIENLSTFGSPDPTWDGFAVDVAIDGQYAIVPAGRSIPDPYNQYLFINYQTAFLFQRSGTRWNLVRQLEEYEQDPNFEIPSAVAMQNGIAAVQAQRTDIYELGPNGWTRAPAVLEREGPGRDLEIDGGRIISGDSTCLWNGRVFEKDADGTWRTSAVLRGQRRSSGCDDEFRGGPVDISGEWAVVQQVNGEEGFPPEARIFRHYGGTQGWDTNGYGSAPQPADATEFGAEVAIRGTDVFVSGSDESGTYVFRERPAMGFHVATRLQPLDSFMGSGRTDGFAKSADYILQEGWSHDRGAGVVNVFVRNTDGTYRHAAMLVGRNGESLGNSIAISGRSVLVGNNGNGLVHYFELPESLATPAVIHDTFASGNGTGWSTSAGSDFGTAPRGISRVFRQNNFAVDARAIHATSDFRNQSIEADVRPIRFGTSSAGLGLTTRYQNEQNYFEVVATNTGRIELRRMGSGTLRTLASAAFNLVVQRTYRLRLESIGTNHRVYVDGALLLDVDTGGPTRGRAALVTKRAQAEFDNVVVSPTPTTTMYAANFENGQAGSWTHTGPGFWNLWTGASTVYNQSSVAGDARASIGVPTDDQIVRVRARLDTFATPSGSQERWFGVMARHVDERNYYYLSLRSGNTVSLRKLIDGAVVPLASAAFTVTPATWYSLRLDAVGNRLRAYVNGALLLEATDDTHAVGNSGPVMFKAAADYDDFSAIQP